MSQKSNKLLRRNLLLSSKGRRPFLLKILFISSLYECDNDGDLKGSSLNSN
jgi:hypothetical protein